MIPATKQTGYDPNVGDLKFTSNAHFFLLFFQTSVVPTPPGSNKPLNSHDGGDHDNGSMTKLPKSVLPAQISKIDSMAHHDQLAKMFPTPPSHEPAENMDVDHHIKAEPSSPTAADLMDWNSDDSSVMLASSKFAPLSKLYSDDLPALILPNECMYKPRERSSQPR